MKNFIPFAIAIACISYATGVAAEQSLQSATERPQKMDLGNFSVSLSVKDLAASTEFYQKLGFEIAGGKASQNWQVLRNGDCTIGLFHGMFEGNIMTFNPGWDSQAEPVDEFMDVRVIQKHFKQNGIALITEADETTKGPASLTLVDPDGNAILFDQHVQ
ncbi:MAG: lactoylglutathione lyase [Chlamydiales bacterium]|jgi:lactoylglutathione lyase